MIYTVASGVHKSLSQTVAKGSGIALPVLALLVLLIATLSFSNYHGTGTQPDMGSKTKPDVSATGASATKPSSSKPGSPTTSTAQPQLGVNTLLTAPEPSVPLSTTSVPSTNTILTGGMGGGGDPTGGTTSSGGSTGTVVCTDTLTLAQICTACTPPITIQPGQKAILAADGTCVAVN